MFVVLEPSDRPSRLYHVRTFGEPLELTWVEEKSTHSFHGGFEFDQLPLLRRKGKQREQNYKNTVNTSSLHALIKSWSKASSLLGYHHVGQQQLCFQTWSGITNIAINTLLFILLCMQILSSVCLYLSVDCKAFTGVMEIQCGRS